MICNCTMAGTSACNSCPSKQWVNEGRFPSKVFFAYGVDAVEVVRCKDCKYCVTYGTILFCEYMGNIGEWRYRTKTDYCSRGARKDE